MLTLLEYLSFISSQAMKLRVAIRVPIKCIFDWDSEAANDRATVIVIDLHK
ncbi:hypothetical protein RchiOBHm_Chr2g0118171 [Rosa chinensis]|uniref:Uncharacterized protein n=1 Tax=Rosa chinensis TaxID=74649 RepID=A0A2P6RRP0_ROSCH|nr:hypothetical protein RchiOBHm_Chr2g0118171 [Rosa chinensis]